MGGIAVDWTTGSAVVWMVAVVSCSVFSCSVLCLGQTALSKMIMRWNQVLNRAHVKDWMGLHGVILIGLVMHGENWITFPFGESVRCGKV